MFYAIIPLHSLNVNETRGYTKGERLASVNYPMKE